MKAKRKENKEVLIHPVDKEARLMHQRRWAKAKDWEIKECLLKLGRTFERITI